MTWELYLGVSNLKTESEHTEDWSHSLYNLTLDVTLATPAIFYSLDKSFPIQPTLKGRALHKGVETRRQGHLGSDYNVRPTVLRMTL